MQRIGIYSGTFNPVHAGHIGFALQAVAAAGLDKVFLMPERHRPGKQDVAHYAHRVAMIRQAIKPHNGLGLIECSEVSFSVGRTLPKLRAKFNDTQLVFLLGSDSLKTLNQWPNIGKLLETSELVVGVREGDHKMVNRLIQRLPQAPKGVFVVESYAATVSSSKIREALRLHQDTEGILPSVRRYSNQNWLYISLI